MKVKRGLINCGVLFCILSFLIVCALCIPVSADSMSGSGDWVYRAEGLSLTAENSVTGEKASVTLDADGAFVKDRTGLPMTDSSLFREESWTGKEGIDDYHLLYEGETASGVAYSALTPPADPGSYTVRIVLYKVKYDSEGGWLSTEKLPFYQASVPSGEYSVESHTEEEILKGKNVTLSADGYYQVGTAEELLYVVNHCGMSANMDITNDIIYNPISVDADRQAASGSETVYSWIPVGTEADPYTGNIRGNGHTIYGLANWDGLTYGGLIGVGMGCSVTDLTLSDCVFGADWWDEKTRVGVFAGLVLLSSDDGHEICFSGLNAADSVVSGCVAGTLIGECRTMEVNDLAPTAQTYSDKRNYLTISGCTSESAVVARITGGGLIGKLSGGTVVTVSDCINTGRLDSGETVGGIVGEVSGIFQRLVFRRAVNTGEMTCTTENSRKMGGVIGFLDRAAGESYDLSSISSILQADRMDDCSCYFNDVLFEKCCSLGIGYSSYAGGLIGLAEPAYLSTYRSGTISSIRTGSGSFKIINRGSLWAIRCMGIQSCDTETAGYADNPVIFSDGGEEYQYTDSAKAACSALGHFPGAVRKVAGGSTCGEAGAWEEHCLLCGEKTETGELPVCSHYACETRCERCGAELTACKKHDLIYVVSGKRITAHCTVCHKIETASLVIDGEETTESADFCFCDGAPAISILKSDGWDGSMPLLRLVFTNAKGKETINTIPSEPEDFGTVALQAYTGKLLASVKASTEPVTVSAHWHEWKYSASGVTLSASCSHCHAGASVTMDADGANAANLNAVRNGFTNYEYEIFIDNGWRDQKGIAEYSILYDGTSVAPNYKTGKKCDAFRRPADAGTYSARAALLTNPLDPDTAYLSTESVSYYISTVPFSQCDRRFYSSLEINRILSENAPSVNGEGFYQVGTREELLWVIYSGLLDAKIDIIADITVNPITVNDETGEVLCGSYDIFNWVPFGCYSTGEGTYAENPQGFTGTIRGNGHTISGLYNLSTDENMGFISRGKGCNVSNLTLENCVFSAKNACGALIGRYDAETPDLSQMTISGLSAYRCYITATEYAGGIIGMVFPSYSPSAGGDRHIPAPSTYLNSKCLTFKYYGVNIPITEEYIIRHNYFTIRDCVSGSTVKGGTAAGGIVGVFPWGTVVTVENCTNFGYVESSKSAGGILGEASRKWQRLVIRNCLNGGTVKGSENLGGIAGLIDASAHYTARDTQYDYERLSKILEHGSTYSLERPCYFNDTLIDNCVSIGDLGVGTHTGGIVGYYDMPVNDLTWGSATMINCKYSQTRNAVGGHNSAGFTFESHGVSGVMAEQLSDSTALSYLCGIRGGHLSETRWEYASGLGCENERTAVLKCRLCGEVLQTKTASAHSHQFVLGECNFCGAKETKGAASVFSENALYLLPLAGVILLLTAALLIYKKKVRKNI